MTKQALILAEFDHQAIPQLEALGYEVTLSGWGQTRHALNEFDLIEQLQGVSLLVVEVEQITARVIDAAPKLSVIADCRAAPVNIDLKAATARGIPVLHTPGRNAISVAEFALGLLLTVGRNINRANRHLREQGWLVQGELPYFHFRGPELGGKFLGLVGGGYTGRELAVRAQALGMKILVYDPYLTQKDLGALGQLVSLDQLLERSDFVSLHVPVTPQTESMIGAAELAQMKRTAFLINTARAAVVDEKALLLALQEGRIQGAALDVFWTEPLPEHSPWLALDNVLLTPHLAGAADDVVTHHSAMIVNDIKTLQEGGHPERCYNPEVFGA